jgi:predicted regulator of Ras-like GTPase activity (Roadblock/LC7/MglB family)
LVEKRTHRNEKTPDTLSDVLLQMNTKGGFVRSVLATSEGLPIASAPVEPDFELASAMIAMLGQVSVETQDHLGLSPVDEVTIRTDQNVHLVCRTILSGQDWVCLCAQVPPGKAYRRVTNKAVRQIRKIIEG